MPLVFNPGWKPSEPLPAKYRGRIEQALPIAERALQPASPEAFAVAMAELFDWIEDFGVIPLPADPEARGAKLERLTERYQATIGDLPDDLLITAIKRTTMAAVFRVLPLPGEIRKHVEAEIAQRRLALVQLRAAARFGRFEAPPLSESERIKPVQLVAARRAISEAGRSLQAETRLKGVSSPLRGDAA
jgi:hypothetical protein